MKISVYHTIYPEVFRSDRARIQKKPRCNFNKDLQFETFPQAMFKRQNIPKCANRTGYGLTKQY